MSSRAIVRWGAVGLALGGVTWAVLGLLAGLGYLQATAGREDIVLFVVAMVLSAVGLVGLHVFQRGSYRLLGRAGFYVALAAMAAHLVGAVTFLAGSPAFQWLSFPVGTLGMLVGFVLYGFATFKAGVLPRPYGVMLTLSMPVSLVLGAYGNVVFGLILLVLGQALWSRGGAAVSQPSRVG